jgi:protein required for attachment to host cells
MSYKHENRVPSNAWVVVADRARARIFATNWPQSAALQEVAALIHPESQEHEVNLVSDAPGKFTRRGVGKYAGEPQTDFRHRTALQFAATLGARLEEGRVRNEFGHLVLIAPALFLGSLRAKLSSPLAKMVAGEIDKDYTRMRPEQVLRQLHRGNVLQAPDRKRPLGTRAR